MNVADLVQAVDPRVVPSPWAGYEHVRGYAVLSLPFSSGHLLGLRVFPESDFAPYVSVWHQTPDGDWAIYNDGVSLDTTCPRWWGAALRHAALARIEVTWTGENTLRVEMDEPPLKWTLSVWAPPLLRVVNAVSARLPLWTWKAGLLVRAREWMARTFVGMGDLRFAFTTPSGQDAVIMPEQVLFIGASEAVWEGRDLGDPVRRDTNPTIGTVPLPPVPTFMIGQAHARIKDPEEYRRTRERVFDRTSSLSAQDSFSS